MGDAFQCDRCGDFCSGSPQRTIPLNVKKERVIGIGFQRETETISTSRAGFELCDECGERLTNFLKGKLGFPDP